ncbi:hypothetical protein ACWC9H_35400 [Streptomyces sp. NPDC001251]
MTDPQLEPDIEEVLQEEHDYAPPAVAVDVCGPVRVQHLPRKGGATRTVQLDATNPRHVLTADPRRGRALLVSFDQDFLVAYSEVGATSPATMARWPKTVPLEVGATVDVFVMAQTGTTALSVIQESWVMG